MITSSIILIPAGKIADRIGRKPPVVITYLTLFLFPLLFVYIKEFALLILLFILAGFDAFSRPALSSILIESIPTKDRGKIVGFYYWAGDFVGIFGPTWGALLWSLNPNYPFLASSIIGLASFFTVLLLRE